MSIIDLRLRTNFENTVMMASRCIIPAHRRFSTRSITNRDDIIDAVKDVYFHPNTLWAHARGGKGKYVLTHNGIHKAHVNMVLEEIGNRIFKYFNSEPNTANNQVNFDVFHKSLCKKFLNDINRIRASVGYADMSYGQAQKLINLSFKYISCFSDYLLFADLFEYCHIIIDNKVLNNLGQPSLSIIFGISIRDRIHGLSGGTFNHHGWTDFSETDYDMLVEEYRRVVGPYLGNLSYISLEYNMWPAIGLVSTTDPLPTPIPSFHM
jgi:hypothetical protein